MSTRRDALRAKKLEELERSGEEYRRKIEAFGLPKDIDLDIVMDAASALRYDVDLRRWPGNDALKEAVRRAREELDTVMEFMIAEYWRAGE